MDKRAERRELVKAIADNDIPHSWLDPLLTGPNAVIKGHQFTCRDIEALMTAIRARVLRRADALDQQSPPAHAAADHGKAAPSQEGAGSATAEPGGEPKERVCVWTARPGWSAPACQATRQLEWRESTAAAFKFCPDCGGKIITEAT